MAELGQAPAHVTAAVGIVSEDILGAGRGPGNPAGAARSRRKHPVGRTDAGITSRGQPASAATDAAMRGERSMTKTSLSCTPKRIRLGTRRRARLIGAGVAAAALVSVLVPALGAAPGRRRRRLGRGAAHCLAPVSRGQRGRDGGRVLVCHGGGPPGLPESVRAEDQAGSRGARGHRIGPPWRDLLQPGRARRGRNGTTPGIYRVLAERTAARLRPGELGPTRVRGEHGGPVLPERSRGKRVPRQVLRLPRRAGPAGRLHPPLARIRQDLRRAQRCAAQARLDRRHRPRPESAPPGRSASPS